MAKTRIVLLYKPYGTVSQFTESEGKPTLARYGLPAGVYPAGRLDHDSEGLLLLTDDGGLNHRLTDPKKGHPRAYWVQVERVPDEAALEKLRRGVELADGRTLPCKVRRLEGEPDLPPRDPPIRFRLNVPAVWLELTLTEGRNRQVRRMTAAVGHPTLRLVRSGIGRLTLKGLEPGKWRWVDRREVGPDSPPGTK
ncbi:MAG TPA: pseudouridine synthase [Elusimicrobiota bacterium]|nr:pseudouridine synthase [Elusimicrobiota bacterium]